MIAPLLLNQRAPDFNASAVLANGEISDFSLHNMIQGKYAVLFFYPLDFTFVCPSEIIALNKRIAEFTAKNAVVIGISIDSQFTHHAWRNTPVAQGGIGPVNFPLVADVTHDICRAYGVQHPELGVAYRATFVIDEAGNIRTMTVHDLPIGRNIDDILRQIDAIQHHQAFGEVCPANWNKGDMAMEASIPGVAKYLAEHQEAL